MKRPRGLALLAVTLLVVAGCATSTPSDRGQSGPRVRCLTDPTETGTRPLFFLFCVQSP